MFLSFIRQNAKPNATTPPTAWHRMKANIPETQIKTCDVLEENVERPFSFNIFNIESSVYCFKSSSSHGVINTSILSYGSNCVWGCVCGGVHGLLDSGGLYFANELAVCHMVPVFTSLGACGIFSSGLEPPPHGLCVLQQTGRWRCARKVLPLNKRIPPPLLGRAHHCVLLSLVPGWCSHPHQGQVWKLD